MEHIKMYSHFNIVLKENQDLKREITLMIGLTFCQWPDWGRGRGWARVGAGDLSDVIECLVLIPMTSRYMYLHSSSFSPATLFTRASVGLNPRALIMLPMIFPWTLLSPLVSKRRKFSLYSGWKKTHKNMNSVNTYIAKRIVHIIRDHCGLI